MPQALARQHMSLRRARAARACRRTLNFPVPYVLVLLRGGVPLGLTRGEERRTVDVTETER